jgi:NAD(P)-dependent dehydrogenase (short-subunit alcohol dehydrogenase family)
MISVLELAGPWAGKEVEAMTLPFDGKVAIVTGAGSGIGRATAEALAAAGARVAVNDLDAGKAEAAAAAIRAGGGSALAAPADVSRPETGEELVRRAVGELGSVDVLVNCAGVFRSQHFTEAAHEEWMAVLRTNLLGAVHTSRAAARAFIRAGRGGRIVNVSSVHGFLAESRASSYDVSKGGLNQLTRALAVELAPQGILVNGVAPGFVDTPMAVVEGVNELETREFKEIYCERRRIPLGRPASPPEIARAILFLAGPENTYITGVNLVVDGGLSITF